MTQVLATEQPSDAPPGRSLVAIGHVAYLVCTLLQLVSLAIDRFAFALVAPILALVAIGALGFLVVTAVSVREIATLVRDRKTRVVHGLEHATLAVLKQRGAETFNGITTKGAFVIEIANGAQATSAAVRDAALEAIRRIRGGERSLAYTRHCGTSLMVALLLASLVIVSGGIAGVVAGLAGNVVAGLVAVAVLLAWLASRWLGLLAQRYLTVSTRFAVATVGAIANDVAANGDRASFSVAIDVDSG